VQHTALEIELQNRSSEAEALRRESKQQRETIAGAHPSFSFPSFLVLLFFFFFFVASRSTVKSSPTAPQLSPRSAGKWSRRCRR
jgi:hypothetical protein